MLLPPPDRRPCYGACDSQRGPRRFARVRGVRCGRHLRVVPVPQFFFFFQAEDGIRDLTVTGVQTCALPISQAEVTVAKAEARLAVLQKQYVSLERRLELATRDALAAFMAQLSTSARLAEAQKTDRKSVV